MSRRRLLLCAFVASLASPAWSQPAGEPTAEAEWDLTVERGRWLTMAMVYFDSGIGLATRCRDGAFDVLIAGLPEVDTPTRTLMTSLGEEHEERPETWTVGTPGTVAMSHYPAPFARRLREGGELNIVVPGENGGPNRRYILPLPPSPRAVEDTLAACDRPLNDPRDEKLLPWVAPDGTPSGLEWARVPKLEFPEDALAKGIVYASVVVSCVTTESGELEDCVVESEHPSGHEFGDAILRATRRARLRVIDGEAPVEGRMASWRTIFRMVE